jgi:formylglycine-generating enzyme required for sulfatase activity
MKRILGVNGLAGNEERKERGVMNKMKTMMRMMLAVVGLVILTATSVVANNLTVANAKLVNQNVIAKTVDIQFDLTWDNSWRVAEPTCTNWDAAWVFVKFRPQGNTAWEHAILSTNDADHTPAANSMINSVTNGAGVFVYRDSVYAGSVSYTNARLRWNYGSNGYTFASGATVDVSVLGVEMVYVPQGSFSLGDGDPTSRQTFYMADGLGGTTTPYVVSTEAAITMGTAAGNLYFQSGGSAGNIGNIPAAFPKGFNAFYCMKYEITEGQYVDFLNKLSRSQQTNRVALVSNNWFALTSTNLVLRKNGVRCPATVPAEPSIITFVCDGDGDGTGNGPNDGKDRGCGYLTWYDGLAYADWAGLRPMTETEFEKACRGLATPIPLEYAWGNTTLVGITNVNGTAGSGTETPMPANANAAYNNSIGGPMRVGIYATATSDRTAAGATYWGIMEMSGNLQERPVTAGYSTGRSFTGLSGDGILDSIGNANTALWPLSTSGFGNRGGGFGASASACRVSDRAEAHNNDPGRQSQNGFRCIRTVP